MSHRRAAALLGCCALLLVFSGCEQLFDKGTAKNIELGDKSAAAGNYADAVRLYESSLDGTVKTADVHYKLAIIYADKLKNPIDALHHFKRYLDLLPNGAHSKEARDYKKEGEQKIVIDLTNGSPFTQEDAVRLKNQNLALTKALAELRAIKSATPVPLPPGAKKGDVVQKPVPPGARTHTVQSGETLASIAQKFYKSKARWKDIEDANFYPTQGTVKIRAGMTLVIP